MARSIRRIFAVTVTPLALVAGLAACDRERDVTTADNTAINERDRMADATTPTDQSESPADREVTRKVRQALVDDDALSVSAKNVKIVTTDGTVTLRGPVANAQERARVAAAAQQVAGIDRVQNQLEVAGE